MTDASHVIPPDGTCAVGSCYAPRAHDGTHFCVMHQPHDGKASR